LILSISAEILFLSIDLKMLFVHAGYPWDICRYGSFSFQKWLGKDRKIKIVGNKSDYMPNSVKFRRY